MRQAALHRRPALDSLVPALELRKIGEVLTLRAMMSEPGIGRDINDRVVAGEIRNLAQPLVDHPVYPARFVGVAIDRVLDLFRSVAAEMMRLAEHRPDARHLEHQPLERV